MAKLKVSGSASGTGTITLIAPATSTDRTITLPDESITLGGGVDGIVSTANDTAITIDSSENVSVGASSIMQNFGSNRTTLAVKGVGTDNYSSLQLGNGGSTTSGKYHGFVNFYNNNTSVARVASISNSNAVDADLTFFTAPSGGGIQERLRLTSDGRGLSQFTAKAWVYFEWEATIQDSHNVSSVSHPSTGNYTVNFTNNMGNTKYAAFADGDPESSTATNYATGISPSGRSTSLVKVRREKSDGNFNDSQTSVVIFGD